MPKARSAAVVTLLMCAAGVAVSARPPCDHRLRAAFMPIVAPRGACSGAPTGCPLPRAHAVRKIAAAPRRLSAGAGDSGGEGDVESAAKLDSRFYDLFDRSQSKVDMIERTEALAPTGFEVDGAVLLNQRGERVEPESLRDSSVGERACVLIPACCHCQPLPRGPREGIWPVVASVCFCLPRRRVSVCFWAALFFSSSWCPDCVRFLPLLRAFYEQQNAPAPDRDAPGAETRCKVLVDQNPTPYTLHPTLYTLNRKH